jgi:hypothetical protein
MGDGKGTGLSYCRLNDAHGAGFIPPRILWSQWSGRAFEAAISAQTLENSLNHPASAILGAWCWEEIKINEFDRI